MRDVSERRKFEDQGRASQPSAIAGGEDGGVGSDRVRRGARAEQPARHDPDVGGAAWQRGRSTPDTKRGLETILSESERAAKIVRNLLTFARKRDTTRALVDLNGIVRETLALRAYEQRVSNVTTLEALASGLPQVFADPHQVTQVLLNLIINAEHAMLTANGRGTLIARTWYDDANEVVLLEINDDGPGVPEEVQMKIFDPFFTTKAVGKGTGLGLTVAYAIVQEHGGHIRVTSTPGLRRVVLRLVPGGRRRAAPLTNAGRGGATAADGCRVRRTAR